MKEIVIKTFFGICFLLGSFSKSQTIVGGSISTNTTWDLTGSPYLVQNNVAVMSGVILTINPGVVVKFDSNKSIQFFGALRAIGTQNQKIIFTSGAAVPSPGDWGYILFNSNSPAYNFFTDSGSIMKYCTVEYAGGASVSYNGAVRMNNSFPYLNNCTVHNNSKTAIKGWNLTDTLCIDSCTIQSNTVDTGAVYIKNGAVSIRGCNISNNSLAGIFVSDAATVIKHSVINANNTRGIMLYKSGNNIETDSIISNTISNNLTGGLSINYISFSPGVDVNNKNFVIDSNTILGNTGNGISFSTEPSSQNNSLRIFGNTLNNNSANGIGVYYGFSNVFFNNLLSIGNNDIKNNGANGFYLYNNGQIKNNSYVIYGNTIWNNAANGIDDSQGWWEYFGNSWTVTDNIIGNNTGNGIKFSLTPGGLSNASSNIFSIKKNKLINNGGSQGSGIYMRTNVNCPSKILIEQNVIAENTSVLQGGGIYLGVNDSNTILTENTLINNSASTSSAIYYIGNGNLTANKNTIVYNKATGNDSLRMVYLEETVSFNNNNIYTNSCSSPINLWYDDFNGSTLNAQYCYWKQSTSTGIDGVIWDYFDDQNLGIVNPSGFQLLPDTSAPVTPVENVIKTNMGGGNIQVSWAANSETDLAGYKIYWGSPTGYSFANSINAGNVITYTITAAITDTIVVTAYDSQANGIDDQVEGHESWFNVENCNLSTGNGNPGIGQNNYLFYPNPAKDFLVIKNISAGSTISLYDFSGKLIMTQKSNSAQDILNTSGLPNGIFLIEVNNGNSKSYQKIIINN
ncbi:MAG: right-handed parallel beta-helix repeat-containing protein [Bacteroidia bacterium]|nr:right-handed parallel beta-helix repeat-containing protein [Bacteroidia bacterium]